jgi:hypothetical protein
MSGVNSPPTSSPNRPPISSPVTNPTPDNILATETTLTSTTAGAISELVNGDLHVSLSTGDLVVGKNFYPDFGASESCRNDGSFPEWITKTMMKTSKIECCSSYFRSSFDDCFEDNPFYPNFQGRTCANDGKHPRWMGGAYFFEKMELCCNNFFRGSDCNNIGR